MLVECLEGADEGSRVLQHNPNPVVQVLDHLVVLADGLQREEIFEHFPSIFTVTRTCKQF